MKKLLSIAALSFGIATAAQAQTTSAPSSNATQQVQLSLSDALELSFVGSGNTGTTVSLPFTTVAHYSSGVQSAPQDLVVKSNKKFSVSVKTSAATFSYAGSATSGTNMPVNGVLGISVNANSTGGSVAAPFSTSTYSSLTAADQTLISNANNGGNQTFSIKYEAKPSFAYPAGTYTVDVVYTATQL